MPQPPDKPAAQKPQDIINIVYVLASIYNGCFTPLIRSGFGLKAFAAYPLSLIFMFVYAGYARCPQLIRYVPVWILLIVFRRITADPDAHSRYQGYPLLARRFPFMKGELMARKLEPWLCFYGGIFLLPYSQPLGAFVMGACLSLLITLGTEMELVKARKRAMHDQFLDSQRMAEIQRGGTGWRD